MEKAKRLSPDEILENQLVQDEEVLWVGQPNPIKLLKWQDILAIPFSLYLGGFTILVLIIALFSDTPTPFLIKLLALVFLIYGQYMIWGRFVYDYWHRRKTYYAITDNRIIIFTNLFGKEIRSIYLKNIPELFIRRDTIFFGKKTSFNHPNAINNASDALHSIPEAESVYHLLEDQIDYANR